MVGFLAHMLNYEKPCREVPVMVEHYQNWMAIVSPETAH